MVCSSRSYYSIQSKALNTFGYSGRLNVAHVRETHEAHRRIYDAIIGKDADGAARAICKHIEFSWRMRRPSSTQGPQE